MTLGCAVCDSIGRNHCLRQIGTASASARAHSVLFHENTSKSMEKSKMGVTDSSLF